MTQVWPDVPAFSSPGLKVRDQLDYVIWVTEALEPIGSYVGPDVGTWRGRVQRAYAALVDSMAPGHGDPLPPDVPPALKPGVWPDVPAGSIPGMTVRHQLTVVRAIASTTREDKTFPRTPADLATWTSRVQTAFDALDHGAALAMPESARSTPPPPPPAVRKGTSKGGAAKPRGKARAAKAPPKAPAKKASRPAAKKPKKR